MSHREIGRKLYGTVLLATLGERDTIEVVLQEVAEGLLTLRSFGWQINVLVVDDSRDLEFHRSVEGLSGDLKLEVKVSAGPGCGLGAAILSGFADILKDPKVEFIVNLDADGQHDGRQIGDLLRAHVSNGNDITIGSRWTRGGRCYGLSSARRIVSRCSSLALRFNGVPWHVKDPTTSFRIYNREAITTISRELVGFDGFSFFGAAIAFADKFGLTVREVPIHFRPRLAGNSNLKGPQVLQAVKDLRQIGAVASMISRRRQFSTRSTERGCTQVPYDGLGDREVLSNSIPHIEKLLDEVLGYIGNSVLEVGAGVGGISRALISRDRAVTACEPNSELFSLLEKNLASTKAVLFNGTLANFEIEIDQAKKYDSVVYINALEHIEDDLAELSLAKSMIAVHGNLVIRVPAMPSFYSKLDAKSGHIRRYRKQELESLMINAGLKVVNIRFVSSVGGAASRFLLRICGFKYVLPQVDLINSAVISPLSRIVFRKKRNSLTGPVLVAIAEVP